MTVLITGTAGFIGFSLAQKLLNNNHTVIGVDNINDYYSVELKLNRLHQMGISQDLVYAQKQTSQTYTNYHFYKLNLEDKNALEAVFQAHKIDAICNLAAQAGVRYSLENPRAYVDSNIIGFLNILDLARDFGIKDVLYASSSSIYGLNTNLPFRVEEKTETPISMYAVTKKTNELMAHAYSHLFGINTIGLRFFTVYGPWGRPDMALFLFTDAILKNKPINVFNNGDMLRDFTYIDDITEGVFRLITADKSKLTSKCYNIGNNAPVQLMDFVKAIETKLGKTAVKNFLPMQDGDVKATFADVSLLEKDVGYKPNTSIQTGINNFIDWYLEYYK